MLKISNLNPSERRSVQLLLFASLFNGVIQSLSQTQDIIARKALHALDWQLMLMTMIWPVANLTSIWWGGIFERSCHKSRFFIAAGLLGRLVLVLGIWISTMNEYLVLLAMMFAANSLLIPAQNSIFQKNIDSSRRAKIFGYTLSLSMVVSVVITFIAGRLLDTHEQSYHWILFGTGICGFIYCLLLSIIRIQEPPGPRNCTPMPWKAMLLEPLQRTFQVMKHNKPFAAFERNFSIYGMGFIMMQPIIPIYLVDNLHLSYTNNFLAKGILSQMGMLFLSPYLGKMHDRMHPFQFISRSFALLMVFPLLFVLSSLWQGESLAPVLIVFGAYLIFGVAMTAVNVAWNMSSIFFAGDEDASLYQGVHVTMTGIRGLVAPVLGFTLLKLIGITAVFVVAAGFFAWASLASRKDFHRIP